MEKSILHKKSNAIAALFVMTAVFLIYIFTVSPTVAFWDCGEYIGASHSLGVPHPPGNPLYVLLGRVFSILFFMFKQVAFRINLISIFSATATAVLIYLIIVRVMISFVGAPDTSSKRVIIYLSGIVGAFFCAFGYTFWFSAVEASVYIPSMFFIALCTWIVLVWHQSNDPDRDRLLILFAYLAYLGIGIHMMSMLALIPAFPFIMLSDKEKTRDWRLWITCLLMAAVLYHVSTFLWIGPAVVTLTLIMSLMDIKDKKKWRFCFWIAFFALLGYSVHVYIPIRSALQPIIDENHPVVEVTNSGKIEWDAFKGFLERKQYGSESMITRMFWRRGSWSKQLGVDGHMGFGGFHLTQYFHFGQSIETDRNNTVFENWGPAGGFARLLIYLVPTFIMIFGWYYLYQKNRDVAFLLIFLFVLTSVGLVLYMNFADGFHAEKRDFMAWVRSGKQGPMPTVHREVRIRDYFFTPGFMFFGMWIGIAAGSILHALFTNKNRFLRMQLAPIMAVLFAVSPALPLSQNFIENNRRGDWVPYDYAYNLLMSCEKDGILFTNGDNDTFPLWFLQEAEGIRRDVRIVNLSLLNTKWYIKQLKDLEPKVPISFSYAKIDALTHELNPITEPTPYTMSNAGINITLPGRKELNALRVQDKMVLNIVDSNRWRKPVYFAVTVSNDNMMGLQPYLQMQGLAYRIMPQRVPEDRRIDVERTVFLLEKVYRFRGLGDGKTLMNETTTKLMSNYAASYLQVALSLHQPLIDLKDEISSIEKALADLTADSSDIALKKEILEKKKGKYKRDLDLAVNLLNQCVSMMPWDSRPRRLRQEFLTSHGQYEEALARIKEARSIDPGNTEYLKREANILQLTGRKNEAMEILKQLSIKDDSDPWFVYSLMAKNFEEQGMFDSAISIMRQFQEQHPGDRRAEMMISRFENLQKGPSPAAIEKGPKPDSTQYGKKG